VLVEKVDDGYVLVGRRGSELALLTAEAALRARRPDASQAVADLREWCAWHAEVCPDLAATLPQVRALLRTWPGPRAQAKVARPDVAAASSARVNVRRNVHLRSGEVAQRLHVTGSGARWLASRGHLPGSYRDPVTGRWRIPESAVVAYREAAGRRRGRAESSTRPGVPDPRRVPAR
jgi:hypothetical protein